MKKALILRAQYHDSVILMRIAAEVKKMPGVLESGLFMGTPANQAMLAAAGLATETTGQARPDDLIISVNAMDETAANAALGKARELLGAKNAQSAPAGGMRLRTIDAAAKAAAANLACFSIPGQYIAYEAARALEHNMNLFIFSDNVSLEEEAALKIRALEKGLLCMGPDCGTAYINGYGLGFYNELPRGKFGLAASSGTGLQAVACALAANGQGVSQGIGVGGRDLHPAVGGLMTTAALRALDQDPATEVIVLIAKEPHPDVAPVLEKALASIAKPVVVCCLGFAGTLGGRPVAETLDDAVAMALAHCGLAPARVAAAPAQKQAAKLLPALAGRPPRLLGLYTGGTLGHEAWHVLKKSGIDVSFGEHGTQRNAILDMGDDQYTKGRPHPMIDPSFRNEMIERLDARGETVLLLFDLVLGRGAHPDPAFELAAALRVARKKAEADGGALVALGAVVGTRGDYQGIERQTALLEEAGAVLLPTNREAADTAALLMKTSTAGTL